MLKNINDYLSLISLIVLSILAIKYFFGFLFSAHRKTEKIDRKSLLRDYYDNEEQ